MLVVLFDGEFEASASWISENTFNSTVICLCCLHVALTRLHNCTYDFSTNECDEDDEQDDSGCCEDEEIRKHINVQQ